MSAMIQVGAQVVAALRARGLPVRAAAAHPAQARLQLGDQVQVTPFVFGQPETYAAAFHAARAVFLLRPPQIADVRHTLNPAMDAAVRAGVTRVVFLSVQGAERIPMLPHYWVERHLRQMDVEYTFLRAGFFMQNLSTTHAADIREFDEIFVPAGHGRTAFVDVADVGAVAAAALAEPGSSSGAYELTGRAALNYAEVACVLSRVLERNVRYVDPGIPRFWRRMRRRGHPASLVLVMVALYTSCRLGLAGHVTDTLERLLGRPPTTLEEFARTAASAWSRPTSVRTRGLPDWRTGRPTSLEVP